MSLIQKGNHRIDCGQSGAYQQHRTGWIEAGQCIGCPGIGAVEGGVIERLIGDRHRLGGEIANRQDRQIGGDRAVPVQRQHQRVAGAIDRQHLAMHQFQPVARLGAFDLVVQQAAHVRAKCLARHERAGSWHHAVQILLGLSLQPVQEMGRFVMERTHTAGGDIQEMAGIGRRIGLPPAELTVAFDQIDLGAWRAAPQQMQ
jgi:hypothetical protein